jgi:ectoine hydroxylase-related dioxygenase (phytanoyl-CoA dioxygenase family)
MDLADTYFDVPRLRVVPHSAYLTAGVSYAYKAHRDQWYGGPWQQLNYWMPVWPVTPDSAMVVYPWRWDRPCENSSGEFDYAEWTAVHRPAATNQVGADTRKHPLPLEELPQSEELRYGAQPGDALIFAGAQLHATAPNTSGRTRFSLDFRTISMADLEAGRGAPNVDCEAKGTTLPDYLRGDDLSPLDRDRLPATR